MSVDLRRVLGWPAACAFALLLVPLIATWLTEQVTWTVADFVVAWLLLFGAGLAWSVVARRGRTVAVKAAAAAFVGAGLLLIWAGLAVGL